jgi:hypothetical protein
MVRIRRGLEFSLLLAAQAKLSPQSNDAIMRCTVNSGQVRFKQPAPVF